MTPEEVLAEAKWQLEPERGEDWRRFPAPTSPAGNFEVGDFGDAGSLVRQLTKALEITLVQLRAAKNEIDRLREVSD